MSKCSNCYSNCTDVQSDKCVKYTGVEIPLLDINKGDTLSKVTEKIINFIGDLAGGSNIFIDLDGKNLCDIVSSELSNYESVNLSAILNTFSKVICAVNTRLESAELTITNNLLTTYTVSCIPGIPEESTFSQTIQALLTDYCTTKSSLTALTTDVAQNYVKVAEVDNYISAYLTAIQEEGSANKKDKMVPYTVVEYYGPLNVFDSTGAGLNDWAEIYLCNGNNGTPDKRGRIGVGATESVGGGSFSSTVNPSINGNPSYSLLDVQGSNTVTLTELQIPSHTHTAVATTNISPSTHNHGWTAQNGGASPDGGGNTTTPGSPLSYLKGSQQVNVTLTASTNVTNSSSGGGESHSNIPPVLACYYIMYIPS